MKPKNLRSAVFFRHQGGYSLKKLWFHLMLLDFGRLRGLNQSEEDPLIVRAKAQPDSESDPEEDNHNPFHDSENSYSTEHPRFISQLLKFFEAMRLPLHKNFPKCRPNNHETIKSFFADDDYHLEIFFSGDDFRDFEGGLRSKEKAIAMIRAVISKYFPNGDPSAPKDPQKKKKFNEEIKDIVERYNNGDPLFIADPLERVREEVRREIHELYAKYFPKDDPGARHDEEKIDKFFKEAFRIVERYPSYYGGHPQEDDSDSGSDTDGPDSGSDTDGPGYEGDPPEDHSDSGSDTDGPDSGSDTDGPDSGSDTDGPDSGSDTDGPDSGSDTDGPGYGYGNDPDDPNYGRDPDDPDYGYGNDPDDPYYGRDPDDPDYGYGNDPDDPYYGYGNDPDALESDPEYYLQKKRNPGGDYLQIDRYPEDTCFKIERDPQKIDRYIEEPYLDYGSNPQKDDPSYGGDPQEDDPSYGGDPQEDDSDSGSDPNPRENYTHKYKHLWLMCDDCYALNYRRFLNERLYTCEGCGFHFKMNSSERLKLLIDPDTWDPMNEKMASLDPIEFHSEEDPYIDRIDSYQKKTGLIEAIQTGLGHLNGIPIAMGVMEFGFMGGSMGSVVGEKITRLVEYATNQSLPLIIVCASGGARMQEGSLSLIQMAKISSSLYDFQTKKKLFYISILTSPTTGGVTASFGMLGDVIFAEPDAYIAFAGKRVIELTLNKEVPEGSQETENLFDKGLFDLVVPRKKLKSILNKLFGSHGFSAFTLNQNHSSITEH
uniref:Acetyl-coenzyme A carboxylase carboxyl transferase subunit beta, chloroplastic n=1 Tax=Lonicera angustifolia var. myrtillus TaxID=486679 RepID=A0A7T8F394_9DIPS|nr:acetyl-CoA carboxylase beta subunit [Lonicera angustifolia var. myrtillus]